MATWTEDFESGNNNNWDRFKTFGVNGKWTESGSYSAQTDSTSPSTNHLCTIKPWGGSVEKPSYFQQYYYETSNNSSLSFALIDGGGNVVVSAGTDNPQYVVSTSDTFGSRTGAEGNYKEWIKLKFQFDWSNNSVDVKFRGSNNQTYTKSINNNGIKKLEVWRDGGNFECAFDSLEAEYPAAPSAPSNLSASYSL